MKKHCSESRIFPAPGHCARVCGREKPAFGWFWIFAAGEVAYKSKDAAEAAASLANKF
jgi:hypothetical protein